MSVYKEMIQQMVREKVTKEQEEMDKIRERTEKAIEVRSLTGAKDFVCAAPWAAISVMTFEDEHPVLSKSNLIGRLDLTFADIESEARDTDEFRSFNQDDAKRILFFVEEMWPRVQCIMVHCAAGMSRSPAIAAAIEHIWHGPGRDNHWFARKTPNALVYRTLLDVHHSKTV